MTSCHAAEGLARAQVPHRNHELCMCGTCWYSWNAVSKVGRGRQGLHGGGLVDYREESPFRSIWEGTGGVDVGQWSGQSSAKSLWMQNGA